jgi:3-deoxy-D-manno-octulosonic-acid transferase
MQNFQAITAEFVAAGACVQVRDVYELQRAVRDLCADEPLRAKIVAAAQTVIERNVGATQRTVDLIRTGLELDKPDVTGLGNCLP